MFDKLKRILKESEAPYKNMDNVFKEKFIKYKELVIWGILIGVISILSLEVFSYFVKISSWFFYYHFNIGNIPTLITINLSLFRSIYLITLVFIMLRFNIFLKVMSLIMYASYKIANKFSDNEEIDEIIEEFGEKNVKS